MDNLTITKDLAKKALADIYSAVGRVTQLAPNDQVEMTIWMALASELPGLFLKRAFEINAGNELFTQFEMADDLMEAVMEGLKETVSEEIKGLIELGLIEVKELEEIANEMEKVANGISSSDNENLSPVTP